MSTHMGKRSHASRRSLPGMLKWTAIASLAFLTTFESPQAAFAGRSAAVVAAKPIKGVVSDENGQPVSNVTVTIKGTNRGTTTDATGTFTISAEPGDVLVFTSVATEEQQLKVGKTEHITITLNKKDKSLDEVVVLGYGQAKSMNSVVGSIAQVTGKDLENRPSADPFDAIQGKVAGLSIYSGGGEPSAVSSLSINGVGSLSADVTPLYIMDGIQVSAQTIQSMNANDIATMSVLRDASATSIYGARAANGVIIITTKKGVVGHDNITASEDYGLSSLLNNKYFQQFMSGDQLADFQVAQGLYTQAQMDALRAQFPGNTEWYKSYYKDHAAFTNTQLALSGAANKTSYYVSGSYLHDDGIAYRSSYNRYTFRANISSKINDWANFGVNLSGGYSANQTNPYGSNSIGRGLYFLAPSYYSPIDPATGKEYPTLIPGWGQYNPKYLANTHPSPTNNLQLDPTGFFEIHPIKGMTLRTQGGIDFYDNRNTTIKLPSYQGSPGNGSTGEYFVRESKKIWTNTLEYNFRIGYDHSFTALAGTEYTDDKYESFQGTSTGQTDDRLTLLNDGPSTIAVASYNSEYKYISYFGRLNYTFRNKYNLEGSFRQDASSLFGASVRTANFWSGGVMWDAKKEDFLDRVKWLGNLKVHASIGTQGNSAIQPYQTLDLTGTNTYNASSGWYVASAGNANLTWEKVTNATFGADFDLFKIAHFDIFYYDKHTNDMLLAVPYPYTSGFSSVLSNIGTLKNTGFDIKVSVDVVKNKDLYIAPFATLTTNTERVTKLFQGLKYYALPGTGVLWAVGKPVSFIAPIWAGVNPANGNPTWYTAGSDPTKVQKDPKNVTEGEGNYVSDVLQQNTGERVNPPLFGGYGLDASYKGFVFNVAFSWFSGKYIFNNDQYFYDNPNVFAGYNASKDALNYWKTPGQKAKFPGLATQTWTEIDDSRVIQNASFMRMKSISLGYNLPQSLLGKTKAIKNIEIYVQGRNLLTWTKYPGVDPEVNSNLTLGAYPSTKAVTFGAKITL